MMRQRVYASRAAPPKEDERGRKTTEEVFAEHHEFVRDEEKDAENARRWETRMVSRYYAELHKEYAICDLSRWREGAVGLRWRTEAEVVRGKGEAVCGARGCESTDHLRSYELPFEYEERGESKMELVKARVCRPCAKKLARPDAKLKESKDKRKKKKKRKRPESESD